MRPADRRPRRSPAPPAAALLSASQVRRLRPPKAVVDPWRPLGILWETERVAGGALAPVLTVFLAGAECPFPCVFCDLWRHTLAGPTPRGAIPAQLDSALAAAPIPPEAHIKLYNASSFFAERAVPAGDDAAIAARLAPFTQTVVECHPRLVGARCVAFSARLGGRLQVAMGLETVHPRALPRLGKAMTLADFAAATDLLLAHRIGVRAFVLVGVPFVPAAEAARWAERSAAWAFARGVEHVCLVPVRGGEGALAALARRSEFEAPGLAVIEEAFARCLALGRGVVTLDLWDLDRHLRCGGCRERRRERLARMNGSGAWEPIPPCPECG